VGDPVVAGHATDVIAALRGESLMED
jgi:hypothetical protein